jgi:hypothetical protein
MLSTHVELWARPEWIILEASHPAGHQDLPEKPTQGWACHFRLDVSSTGDNRGFQITRFADMLSE